MNTSKPVNMNYLSTTWSIARYSLLENYKNRFFGLFIIFAGVLIYASLLAGVMAVDEEARVLADLGLALMELISLAYALLAAADAITREIRTKTIYLVFSRPVPRPAYLAGKAAGLYAASALMLGVMALIHLSLLYSRGFAAPPFYAKAVFFIWCKLLIITSAGLFISLFATSTVSAVAIMGILWTLGHFTSEAQFLISRSSGASGLALKAVAYAIPDLQLFNARDLAASAAAPPAAGFLAVYLLLWLTVPYLFSLLLFRKKEF
ncbi:MAG: ABC transporter permease subunit [Elusimicrobiales bacterium]|jgi:ABC-type transport system involved in multi-copper enzyme maturation permease subunit